MRRASLLFEAHRTFGKRGEHPAGRLSLIAENLGGCITGVDEFTGDPGPRGWNYWTRNKLEILAGYLPAFNNASKKASERIYLDLMAGRPVNVDAVTGEVFDGSARIAMASGRPPAPDHAKRPDGTPI